MERALALYGRDGMALSFNGGKDSTVLLHIVRAALALHDEKKNDHIHNRTPTPLSVTSASVVCSSPLGVPAFFFQRDDDFPEIRDFVDHVNTTYCSGELTYVSSHDYKGEMENVMRRTGARAFLIGTRRGDPNAADQEHYSPSSRGWPPFMRINPIIDWSFAEVWSFLRTTGVRYCDLYDHGYTSIGAVHNTFPNTALRRPDGGYEPAWALADGRMERAGRSAAAAKAENRSSAGLSRTAAIVLIGDELLTGKVGDVNLRFLCRQLRAAGWRVGRASVVPDDVDAVAAEVADTMRAYDAVLTAGGVGPTLDDVTMAGIAAALGRPTIRHAELEARMRAVFNVDIPTPPKHHHHHLTAAHLKMTLVPDDEEVVLHDTLAADLEDWDHILQDIEPSLVSGTGDGHHGSPLGNQKDHIDGDKGGMSTSMSSSFLAQQRDKYAAGELNPFPLVQCRNIFVLPGVPAYLRLKWPQVRRGLHALETSGRGERGGNDGEETNQRIGQDSLFHSTSIRLDSQDETAWAALLEEVQGRVSSQVSIGSYPVSGQTDGTGIIVHVEGKNLGLVQQATDELIAKLPPEVVLKMEKDVQGFEQRN